MEARLKNWLQVMAAATLLSTLCSALDNPCVPRWEWFWQSEPHCQGVTAPHDAFYCAGQITINASATWQPGVKAQMDANYCTNATINVTQVPASPTNWWAFRYGNEPVDRHSGPGLTATFTATAAFNAELWFYTSNYVASPQSTQTDFLPIAFTVRKIATLTQATAPPDRSRKTIGVGEVVQVLLEPGPLSPVAWTLTGAGNRAPSTGNPTFFTAHERASTPTLTATADGHACSVTFTVIEPSSLLFENANALKGGAPPTYPWMAIQYSPNIYVRPDTVNFYGILLDEGAANPIRTQWFTNQTGQSHSANSNHVVSGYVAGKGSQMYNWDDVSVPAGYGPFGVGTISWPLTWYFHIGAGAWQPIGTYTQAGVLEQVNGFFKFTVTKGESGAYVSTRDGVLHWK